MSNGPKILITGGGTGGHVYPAIAIADAIKRHEPTADILFAGTRERLEWEAVPAAGYPILPIQARGFQRGKVLANLTAPGHILTGFVQSWQLVRRFEPDVAVGTGGFVAAPVLLAASMQGVPIVLQEQNAFAGKTNRMLAARARRIHIAFPEARRYFEQSPKTNEPDPDFQSKVVLSGNPTRAVLRKLPERSIALAHFEVGEGRRVLLVFGGSLGSAALNRVMAERVSELLSAVEDLTVIWQTGSLYFDRTRRAVPAHDRLRMLEYLDRMDLAYAAADLALCRSGASTCAELAVTGTPAILVPSPNVAEDHQTENARSMVAAGSAHLQPEAGLSGQLVSLVRETLADEHGLAEMRAAALDAAVPDADDRIARDVLALVGALPRPLRAGAITGEAV